MTETDLLDLLANEFSFPPLQPGEITAKMLANAACISSRAALDRLRKKERDGLLKSHRVRLDNGNSAFAFYKPDG